jgi:diguanylate cyclase (GGDEF)-like protein
MRVKRAVLVPLVGLALVLLIGLADYWADRIIGARVFFLVFYLVPIFWVTWHAGRRAGVVVAVASALVWLAAWQGVPVDKEVPAVFYWDVVVKMGFLVLFSVLLSLLKAAYEKERALARVDDLTGVANRRYFFERAAAEIARSRRYGHPLTAAFIDIDDFKSVNDCFGHETGDALLRAVGDVLRGHLRETDIIGRLGGDEFAVLMPETQAPETEHVLGKLRQHLAQAMEEHAISVTFSVGAVAFSRAPGSVDELIEAADHVMYSVKRDGKDRVRLDSKPHAGAVSSRARI